MAEELLGINKSSLDAIGQAIRNKGGTNALLSFPNGMVSALQAITTVATVTPKITPQQKVLSPSETSYTISPGFHDGNGTVSIQLDTVNNSAVPTDTQQTIYPAAGKFFGDFTVGGTGPGYKVAVGSISVSRGLDMTISQTDNSDLDFTPSGGIIVLNRNTGNPNSKTCACYVFDSTLEIYTNSYRFSGSFSHNSYVSHNAYDGRIDFSGQNDIVYFEGTYNYFLYGS